MNSRPARARPAGDSTTREELELAAIPSAAGLARRFTEAYLRKQDLDEMAGTASLIASELVTNSIRATGITETPAGYADLHEAELARITVRLRMSASGLLIEVRDEDPRPPVPAQPDALDESGRGLMLVIAIAATWGYYPCPGGKLVWAEIAAPTRLAPDCPRNVPMPVPARAPRLARHPETTAAVCERTPMLTIPAFSTFTDAYTTTLARVSGNPGHVISARGNHARECLNVSFTLTDPRARIAWSPTPRPAHPPN